MNVPSGERPGAFLSLQSFRHSSFLVYGLKLAHELITRQLYEYMKNQSLAFSPNFVAEYEQQIKLLLQKIEVDSTGFCDIISQHATTNFIA